ncbi:serine hydrolase domain-containing protein [Bacteroidota bacterium]
MIKIATYKLKIFLVIAFIFIFQGCQEEEIFPQFSSGNFISTGSYDGSYWPTLGWRTCKPEEVGMSSNKLAELNDEIKLLLRLHIDINSVIIVKDGYIVAEQYYSEYYNKDSLHSIYSCTKSITSALIGIAIDQNYITDVNEKMVSFFPNYNIENLSTEKQNISLENMLTMSAGLEWYEMEYTYNDERNTFSQWDLSDNRVKFVLDRPVIASPGEEYSYNTGVSHVLSSIIKNSTGERTDSFAVRNLFTPLGINNFYWPLDAQDIPYGGHGMRLTPRDMAKFGYLYLNNGNWDGNQIISQNWVELSQQKHIERKYIPDYYYGYHWWVSDDNYYSAVGSRGQWITIVPEYDLVVVFTNRFNNNISLQYETPERLLNTYILPAIQ